MTRYPTGDVIELAVGENEIEVVVTADDPTVTKTSGGGRQRVGWITVVVSTDDDYDVNVPNGLTSTTVTATTNYADASYVVQLDGVTDSDGTIPLAVGGNEIKWW